MPELVRLGAHVSATEGAEFPETIKINQMVMELADRTRQHLMSEEYALFPYILEMENVRDSEQPFVAPEFGRVEKPVRAIENEHMICIGLLRSIRALSGEFIAPHGASQEQRTWYAMLKELNADLHLHIHIENNILFPRAIALEAELLQRKGFTSIWFG
jgi:regulator of cell morphogenesis and NO signaling